MSSINGFPLNPVESLKEAFCHNITKHLPYEQWYELATRNAALFAQGDSACASHEFCDGNEMMLEAFREVFGYDPEPGSKTDAHLRDSAWFQARKEDFGLPEPYTCLYMVLVWSQLKTDLTPETVGPLTLNQFNDDLGYTEDERDEVSALKLGGSLIFSEELPHTVVRIR